MSHFEHEGKIVLGFDTGLSERSFAQAKVGSVMMESGYLVSSDGTINTWNIEGTIERNKTMVIWGTDFEGISLDALIHNDTEKNAVLRSLCNWLQAVNILSEKNIFPDPSPRGAIIAKDGAILFPPTALVKRSLESEGEESVVSSSLRYLHPDLKENDAFIFSAATMLYQIFSGEAAFPHPDSEKVKSDIRQGNYIPINLSAFGLDEKIAILINSIIKQENNNVSLIDIINVLESKQFDDFFKPINDDEKKFLLAKREQYEKRNQVKVKTKRFFFKNKTAIIGIGIGTALVIFIAGSIISGRNNRPNTKNMTPQEIVEQYYESFGTLNHDFMDAALINKADKSDVAMVQNLFVISKVRQAYEMTAPALSAQEWIDAGSPESQSIIFGVSDLEMTEISQSEDEVLFETKYLLWMPENFISDDNETQISGSEDPVSIQFNSEIKLIKQKNIWYIAEIIKHQK
jgi:hypothetical protein